MAIEGETELDMTRFDFSPPFVPYELVKEIPSFLTFERDVPIGHKAEGTTQHCTIW